MMAKARDDEKIDLVDLVKNNESYALKIIDSDLKDKQAERITRVMNGMVISFTFLMIVATCLYFMLFSDDAASKQWAQTILGPIVGGMSGYLIGKKAKE